MNRNKIRKCHKKLFFHEIEIIKIVSKANFTIGLTLSDDTDISLNKGISKGEYGCKINLRYQCFVVFQGCFHFTILEILLETFDNSSSGKDFP